MNYSIDTLRRKMQRRARWHDYKSPATYMLTFIKAPSAEPFSQIECRAPGDYVTLMTPTGRLVKDFIYKLKDYIPGAMVWRWVVMPDHIHILLRVSRPLKAHVGRYLSSWKSDITQANAGRAIFADGYNDRISSSPDHTRRLKAYIADNPRRYWIKSRNPDLFTRRTNINRCGRRWEMVGNIFLLNDPEIESVRARRNFSLEELSRAKAKWMMTIDNGGVVIGAFISPHEKEILEYAIAENGRIIYIISNGLGPRFKPQGRLFDLCAEGRLLLIAPCEFSTARVVMTYDLASQLNRLADEIACSGSGGGEF